MKRSELVEKLNEMPDVEVCDVAGNVIFAIKEYAYNAGTYIGLDFDTYDESPLADDVSTPVFSASTEPRIDLLNIKE